MAYIISNFLSSSFQVDKLVLELIKLMVIQKKVIEFIL